MNETPPKLEDALATERTRMAADRTLMGWIRTALSMIGFGFTIFKFLESIQSREVGGANYEAAFSPGRGVYADQHRPLLAGHRLSSTLELCKETEGGSAL